MTCQIFSDQAEVIMGAPKKTNRSPLTCNLQNSDINASHIAALLRGRNVGARNEARKMFWSSFMNYYSAQHANANTNA